LITRGLRLLMMQTMEMRVVVFSLVLRTRGTIPGVSDAIDPYVFSP
jgi:hypothetical protein